MPLIRFFTEDPGEEVLTEVTAINIVEQLVAARRFAAGRGTVGYVAAMVNDLGTPNVPRQLTSPRELNTLYGGFKGWMGDALATDFGTLAATHFEDRGAASGYNGNGMAQVEGLEAPITVVQVPDLAIKDDSIGAEPPGADLLVVVSRPTATFGAYQLPAGTRISDATPVTPYVVATLEHVFWDTDETGDHNVRVRQVSPLSTPAVALDTIDTFVDTPADSAVVVATSAVTVADAFDNAELILRYTYALLHLIDNAPGRLVELVTTDRTEAGIGDGVSEHCLAASSQGLFRIGTVAPPKGTTTAEALAAAADGVARTTLQRLYTSYCHPGWQRQFRLDSDNLVAADNYVTTMPSHVAWAFLAAQRRPEENPARPHPILTSYKAVGIESLALGQPDLKAHEQAGITQPLIDVVFGTPNVAATYHASPMANGTTKFATRRMAFFLYTQITALAAPYHKSFASASNRNGLLSAIDAFLERLKIAERIADYTPTQGDWDPETSQFTVTVAIDETGNLDILTFFTTFGPGAIAAAGL